MAAKRTVLFAVVVLTSMTVLFALGCSSGDKGTGETTMSKEEQYQQFAGLLDFMVEPMMSQFGHQFWDGVDEEDLGQLLELMPGLGKAAGSVVDSVSVSYDFTSGWWFIYAHLADESEGALSELLLEDSVRFETAQGAAQMVPDEQTDHFQHGATIDLDMTLMFGSSSGFAMSVSADASIDVSGLTGQIATANGDLATAMTIDAIGAEYPSHFSFDATGEAREVTFPVAGDCPTGGEMVVSFGLEMDVLDESGNRFQGSDDWNMTLTFTGDGEAEVVVLSDDFRAEFTEQVCE
jgi:hypothetical protein